MERNYEELRKNFIRKYDLDFLRNELITFADADVDVYDMCDNGKETIHLTSHFCDEHLYKARNSSSGMSPMEAVYRDDILDIAFKRIDSKPKFYQGDDLENLRTWFRNNGGIAMKVANFSPNVARKVYERYMPKFNARIMDYSCGWGARLLGCLASNYNYEYVGIEPNSPLRNSLKEFSQFIADTLWEGENKATIYEGGSELFHPELENTVDLSFSSPPYFDLEVYTQEETQSIVKFPEYQAWIDGYMKPTLENIYKYTKSGGYHIVNLKNMTTGKKYPLLTDWLLNAFKVGFKPVEKLEMYHQSQRQFNKNKPDMNYTAGTEPIVVMRKP